MCLESNSKEAESHIQGSIYGNGTLIETEIPSKWKEDEQIGGNSTTRKANDRKCDGAKCRGFRNN